jgi:hypothetical protein
MKFLIHFPGRIAGILSGLGDIFGDDCSGAVAHVGFP